MYCNSSVPDPFLEHIRLICTKIILPTICWSGIFCNILNIIILTRNSMISSTNIYLLTVSILDISYLLSIFCASLQLYGFVRQSEEFLFIVVQIFSPLCSFSSNATSWITVCFTLERLLVVLKPFAIKRWCNVNKAKKVILICLTVTFIFTSPEIFVRNIKCRMNYYKNVTECCLIKTQFIRLLHDYQYFKISAISFVIMPLLILSIVNGLLIKYIISAKRQRPFLSGNNSEISSRGIHEQNSLAINDRVKINSSINDQYKTTYLLVIVVLTFCCLQVPSAIYYVVYEVKSSRSQVKFILGNFCNLLLAVCAAMNFVLYSLFSQKFRLAFRKTFRI